MLAPDEWLTVDEVADAIGERRTCRLSRSRAAAIRFRPRSSIVLAVASLVGLVGFGWPLLIHAQSGANSAHAADAPWLFVAILPLLLAVVLGELAEGTLDAKAIAMLGILAACGAALRVPSPGVAGFEPVFFLSDPLGARARTRIRVRARGGDHRRVVAGDRRGRARGSPSRCSVPPGWASAQGACHRPAGRSELAMLAAYAAVSSLAYGTLLNLWFWPFGAGTSTSFSFVPGAGLVHNLHRFLLFDLTTSLGFDIPRAVTNSVLVLLLGRPVMAALRRANRRAAFDAPVVFDAVPEPS